MRKSKEEIEEINQAWYSKVYNSLIDRAKERGFDRKSLDYYTEKHHIIPKCLGGNDEDYNLCLLTYREHIICHLILCRLNPNSKELILAANFMLRVKVKSTDNEVDYVHVKNSKVAAEIKLKSLEFNRGVNSPSYGRKLTKEHKEAISKANKGRVKSEKTRENYLKQILEKR